MGRAFAELLACVDHSIAAERVAEDPECQRSKSRRRVTETELIEVLGLLVAKIMNTTSKVNERMDVA
jgi:hypothetical protein